MVAVGPKTWNANVTAVEGDVVTAEFGAKWRNYHDGGGLWLPIDPSFTELPGGGFEHLTSPWSVSCPRYATGRISVYNDQDYNPHTGSTFTLTTTPALELDHPDASPVDGIIDPERPWRIVYPNALGENCDLAAGLWQGRYTRAEHLVIIRGLPTGDTDAVITERIYTPLRIPEWTGAATDVGPTGAALLAAGDPDLGIRMRPAVAWYYDQSGQMITCPVSVVVERRLNAGYVLLTKTIPRWFIADALAAGAYVIADETTTTYYPDADAETNSCDGTVTRTGTNVTYSTLTNSATGSSSNDTSTTLTCCDLQSGNTPSRYNSMTRGILGFSVSLSGATVSSAAVGVTGTVKSNTFPGMTPGVTLVSCSPASNTGLTANDFGTFVKALKSDTVFNYTASPVWSGSAVNEFPLNAAAIAALNLTGVNFFGLMDAGDYSSSPPGTWSTIKQFTLSAASAETTGTGPDPYLSITYTAGGGGGGTTTDGRRFPRGTGRGIMRGAA